MGYKYITNNNLYEKQTYMYSEYRGIDFIKEYLDTRKKCLHEIEGIRGEESKTVHSFVYEELSELYKNLKEGKKNKDVIELVNSYTKSFEVRKRIYTEYDAEWKPLGDAGFEEYESYLVFAECLLLAYQYTNCLKYFNCLLKLNDTLISIKDHMGQRSKEHFCGILRQELDIFDQLTAANEVSEEVL